MKKLKFVVVALLISLASQAQTITEKSLLGEWRVAKIEIEGVLANLDTGEVKAVDPEVGKENLDMVQGIMDGGGADEIKEIKLVFKPGSMVDLHDNNGIETASYTLENKANKQVLTLNIDEPSGLEASFEDGLLKLVDDVEGTVMYMAKK
ncbi:MAG: hypothetical protein V4581_14980 [Bacteroidota bacterium]